MGKFTEEEIANKHEILFYTINREIQGCREIHTLTKSVQPFQFYSKNILTLQFPFLRKRIYPESVVFNMSLSVATEAPDLQSPFISCTPVHEWVYICLPFFVVVVNPFPTLHNSFTGIYSPSSAKSSLNLCLNIPFSFLLLKKPDVLHCAVWLFYLFFPYFSLSLFLQWERCLSSFSLKIFPLTILSFVLCQQITPQDCY